jgi:hypothetical protein
LKHVPFEPEANKIYIFGDFDKHYDLLSNHNGFDRCLKFTSKEFLTYALLFNCSVESDSLIADIALKKVMPLDPVIFVFNLTSNLIEGLKNIKDISFAITVDKEINKIRGQPDFIFWKINWIKELSNEEWFRYYIRDQFCYLILSSVQEY